jgi:hypothetical protein
MNLPAPIELLVAVTQLAAVRAVTDAVKANLIAAGGIEGPLGTVTMPGKRSLDSVELSSEYGQRRVIHPEPRYEPRQVIHPEPRIEIAPPVQPEQPPKPMDLGQPLPPPWKMPLPLPPIEVEVVKYVQPKPDVGRRGSMIDLWG